MNIQPIMGIRAVDSLSSAAWPTSVPAKKVPRKKLVSKGASQMPQSHYCSSYAVEFKAQELGLESRLGSRPVPRNSISTVPKPDGTGFIENHLPVVSLDRQPDPFKQIRYRTVYNDDFKSS
jgi:hypothetical protein